MPMYDFECISCGYEFESFAKLADKDLIRCQEIDCRGATKTLITQSGGFRYYEGFDEHLNTYLTGPKQRSKLMKERGIEEVHKAEANRLDHYSAKKQDKTTKVQKMRNAANRVWEKGKFDPNWSKFMN